jgi:hypothetical protein
VILTAYTVGWLLTAAVMLVVGRGRDRVFYAMLLAAIWPLVLLGGGVMWIDSRFEKTNRKRRE